MTDVYFGNESFTDPIIGGVSGAGTSIAIRNAWIGGQPDNFTQQSPNLGVVALGAQDQSIAR